MTSQHPHIIKAMLAGIIAFFMFSVMSVFIKILSETHHVIEIAFYRNLTGSLPFLFMAFFMGRKDILKIQQKPKLVVIRAVLGTITMMMLFGAIAVMPLAEVTAFFFTASLISPVIAYFVLKEKVGAYRWIAIFLGFVGVLIMLQPEGGINTLGVTLALIAAFSAAIIQILLRHLGTYEKPETLTFYFGVIGTAITVVLLPFFNAPFILSEIPLIIGLGITGALGQFLLAYAFGNGPVSVITIFNYSGIIWATLFGWLFWQDFPALTIWIGGAIVIGSNIFIVWREQKAYQESR